MALAAPYRAAEATPSVLADLYANGIYTSGFPNGATLTYTISQFPGGPVLATGTGTAVTISGYYVRVAGYSDFHVLFAPGMEITVTDSTTTKAVTLAAITIDHVDPAGDLIAGTGPAGARMYVEANDWASSTYRWTTVGGNGAWSVGFSPFDVTYSTWADSWVADADGDWTSVGRAPTIISAFLTSDDIDIYGLAKNATVSYTIRQSPGGTVLATGSKPADVTGSAWFSRQVEHHVDLAPGMEITAGDAATTKVLTLPLLSITSIDPATNVVAGIAPGGSLVEVVVGANYQTWVRTTVADPNGNWSTDFTGVVDVTPAMHAEATVADADGDATTTVRKASQTITFGSLPAKTYGDPDFTISATASSGLPVTLAATGKCTLTSAAVPATVHITGAGSCTITASQAGSPDYDVAEAAQTLAIAKAGQTISFGALPDVSFGDADFAVGAVASSDLSVAFTATGSCTVTGTIVHVTGAGSCTITASQAGSENYNPAADVAQTFTVAKAAQTVTFAPLAKKTVGAADFKVHAKASSGLPVSFSARGRCKVRGSTVHVTRVGSCTVTASQAGNANYLAARSISRTFAIVGVPCRVPRLSGKAVDVAKRALVKNHCNAGNVRYAYSAMKKGSVVSQSKRPGQLLPAGSKVNLVVSRGPKP